MKLIVIKNNNILLVKQNEWKEFMKLIMTVTAEEVLMTDNDSFGHNISFTLSHHSGCL
jgi:hypothetical protein